MLVETEAGLETEEADPDQKIEDLETDLVREEDPDQEREEEADLQSTNAETEVDLETEDDD